ncbi:type II toxin-antitoxin system death-on-curing family toxin [Micromonospora inositola]|uniref:Death on curing protein n=1 Tax=Micromonospora inositola TaxID=47865 RepID=A0A1C5H7I5_9ACTN|nr:Fic family protein [Micromonospora inositola]SCG41996.1 death on curing protein [Micromonospora inositola]
MINYLEVDDLMEIASIVLGETPQVRDFGLLSSAVVRPATVAFGEEAYTDLWGKAAALLHSVCMNHALIDGNKRLAWSAARVFLALNEVPIQEVDVDQAEALMMSVASGTLTDVSDIGRELRKLYV